MGRIFKNQTYRDILLGISLLFAIFSLIYFPESGSSAATDGLTLCSNVIIPSLFPFFVLSSLVVELGMSRYLGYLLEGIMVPLFRVGGNCATALALGFVGGYPVGATTAISLYQNGQCSKTEAERLLAFCNNAGPAFILGVVGTGVFSSSRIGLLLYLGHILASLTVGILFRFYKPNDGVTRQKNSATFEAVSFPIAFTRAITGALRSTLNICAFVLFFSVMIRILAESGVFFAITYVSNLFGIPAVWTERFIVGILEMSSGVTSLRGNLQGTAPISMAAFMLGWAGLSIHCQVLAFLGDSGLSMRTYFFGKLLHGGISAVITAILVTIFPLPVPTASYLGDDVHILTSLDFHQTLIISTSIVWFIWICFFLIMINNSKKGGKSDKKGVYYR